MTGAIVQYPASQPSARLRLSNLHRILSSPNCYFNVIRL